MIWNQHPDHYLTVCQIAGYGIQKGCEATVNHNSDADVVLKLPNGKLFPIEYQTSDNHIHEKRLNHITKYGSVVFVGNTASCADMRAAFNGSDEQREIAQQIIISRGKQLANKLDEVIEENNHKTPNLCG